MTSNPPSSLLRRTEERFSPRRQRSSRKHSNKMLPRRTSGLRHLKTPPLLTPTTKPGELSPDTSSNADPTTKEKIDLHTGRDHQKREGRALRPPSTTLTTNGTRVATPCPTRGRTDTDRKGSGLQGGDVGRKQPATAANHHRHHVARRRTSAALRP
jgi:hypothetical protein